MFCKAVLQLRYITHEMTKVQLLDIQPGKAYHLEVIYFIYHYHASTALCLY